MDVKLSVVLISATLAFSFTGNATIMSDVVEDVKTRTLMHTEISQHKDSPDFFCRPFPTCQVLRKPPPPPTPPKIPKIN